MGTIDYVEIGFTGLAGTFFLFGFTLIRYLKGRIGSDRALEEALIEIGTLFVCLFLISDEGWFLFGVILAMALSVVHLARIRRRDALREKDDPVGNG